MTENNEFTPEEQEMIRSTRRFDLRRIIGLVFVLYGIILTIMGIAPSAHDLSMTGGIYINLWTGISMLVVGILFFVWDKFAPVPASDIVREVESIEAKRAMGEGVDVSVEQTRLEAEQK